MAAASGRSSPLCFEMLFRAINRTDERRLNCRYWKRPTSTGCGFDIVISSSHAAGKKSALAWSF
jgi:hypothetical protein